MTSSPENQPEDQSTVDSDRGAGSSNTVTFLSALLLTLSFPIAAWYLIGDLSNPSLPPDEADYMLRPLPLSGGSETAIGITSTIVVCASFVLLYMRHKQNQTTKRTWFTLVPLLVAGFIIAATQRVTTAAVIGANIGGGFAMLVGVPVTAVLIIGAAAYWIVSYIRQRRQH